MIYERRNSTRESNVENTYIYDALHRVVSSKENYSNKTRTYQYDSDVISNTVDAASMAKKWQGSGAYKTTGNLTFPVFMKKFYLYPVHRHPVHKLKL